MINKEYSIADCRYRDLLNRSYKKQLELVLYKKLILHFPIKAPFDSNVNLPVEDIFERYNRDYENMIFIRKRNQIIRIWKEKPEHKSEIIKFKEAFKEQFEKQLPLKAFRAYYGKNDKDRECGYCGIKESEIGKLAIKKQIRTKRYYHRGKTMEVDRIDPNKPYVLGNIIPSCYWCNNAKTDEFSYEEFKKIAKNITVIWNNRKAAIKNDPVVKNLAYSLIPDWEKPKSLVFVYPKSLPKSNYRIDREELIVFYNELLSLINKEIKGLDVTLIVQMNEYLNDDFQATLKAQYNNLHLQFIPIKVNDIWIRDWAPIPARDSEGKASTIKAIYNPQYLQYKNEYELDDIAGKLLPWFLGLHQGELNLRWDFGNITHNGEGVAIVTKRLFTDNNNNSEQEITKLLEEKLKIKKLIVVNEEDGDITGHIDGMVRFLNKNTVAIGTYPGSYMKEHEFMNNIAKSIREALGNDFTIISIPNQISDYKNIEGIPSAFGNYMNFLRIEDKIFIPQYGIKEDEEVLRILKENVHSEKIKLIPVSKGIKNLADLGGVLHCISWACYD